MRSVENGKTQGLLSLEFTIENSWRGLKKNPLNCMINSLFIYDIYRWCVKIESEFPMKEYEVLVGVGPSHANKEILCQKRKKKRNFLDLARIICRGEGIEPPTTTHCPSLMLCKQTAQSLPLESTPHINMHRKCLKVNYRQHSEWRLCEGEGGESGRKGRVPWALILIYGRQTFLPNTINIYVASMCELVI